MYDFTYEIPRVVKFIYKKSRMVVPGSTTVEWEEEGRENCCLTSTEFQFCRMEEKVLKMDSSDSYTLTMDKMVNFIAIILSKLKIINVSMGGRGENCAK